MILCLITVVYLYEIKEAYGRKWLKIFYHDTMTGIYFDSFSHAMFSQDPNRYSIFSLITSSFKTEGYYEFLLEYPELSGFNQWRQNNLPWQEEKIPSQIAGGYTPISISWNSSYWGGLVRSNDYHTTVYGSITLLDGSPGTDLWYYAIGCINPSVHWHPNMPGPNSAVKVARLWLRIDNVNLINKPSLPKHYLKVSFLPILLSFVEFIIL